LNPDLEKSKFSREKEEKQEPATVLARVLSCSFPGLLGLQIGQAETRVIFLYKLFLAQKRPEL
jgi:hypothetical protein